MTWNSKYESEYESVSRMSTSINFLENWIFIKNLTNKNLASIWELHDIREVHFIRLVLPLHCYSGDKN